MRLLHTADWHLGRLLHRVPLLDAQRQVLDHLIDLARDEQVDAIVVSGDLFDRALPPVEAVQLAGDALRRMAEIAPVIAISGNHDSAQRLGFARELIAAGGVHLRTDPTGSGDPVVLADEHGPVAFYGIPYLDPDLCRRPLEVEERSHDAVVRAATALAREDLAEREQRSGHPVRGVVVAHAFVHGGEPSESERDISVGGAQTVSTSAFEGFAYAALGHLHRPHCVGGAPDDADARRSAEVPNADESNDAESNDAEPLVAATDEAGTLNLFAVLDAETGSHSRQAPNPSAVATLDPPSSSPIRYAGSPLAYSFTEADAVKTSAIVEIDADGRTDVRLVPVPSPYRLVRLRGTLDALLDDPTLTEHECDDHWLEVVLTDALLPARPMERLRRRFPRILVLQHVPAGELAPATIAAARVQGRSDLEVLERFVDDVRGATVDDAERPLLRDAVEAVGRDR
ncbi:MAG: exonuclease SbcCD subunit D [Patulibacter sp.]|nr:exonuclease SbcCD subunit D [Patulibacter sp.]